MANVMRIGGGSGQPNVLTVAVDTGAIVTATNGDKTVVGTSVGGNAVLKLPKGGTWSLLAELNGQTTEDSIVIVDDYPVEVSFGLPLSSLAVGSLVRMKESGADVNYRVVHQGLPSSMYDASCDGTWLLREEIQTTMVFHATYNNYKNSSIHTYLTGTFIGLFDAATQAVIKQVKIPYWNGNGNSGSLASGANGLSTKAFLLGSAELDLADNGQYYPSDGACLNYFLDCTSDDARRYAYYNGAVTNWWTRSPYTSHYSSAVCLRGGSGFAEDMGDTAGVRPAFILDSTAMVSGSPNADGSYTLIV